MCREVDHTGLTEQQAAVHSPWDTKQVGNVSGNLPELVTVTDLGDGSLSY